MKTVLFCNGEIQDYRFINQYMEDVAMIICCDGGLRHADHMGLWPDFILGDFDSASPALLERYKQRGAKFQTFSAEKDFTDTELAVYFAIDYKATDILIFGGLGSRFDHSLANIHIMLQALEKNVPIQMINENHIIRLMKRELIVHASPGDIISLIPLSSEVTGVSTEGLEYPLYGETLKMGFARGVSNVFSGTHAVIRSESGVLIVMLARDRELVMEEC